MAETGINYKTITEDMIPALLKIEQAANEFPWKEGMLRELNLSDATNLAMMYEGEIVGYAYLQKIDHEFHLHNLVIAPKHQGRGLGRIFIRKIINLGLEKGCEEIWLETRISNKRAISLYLKFGFTGVAERPNYYPTKEGYENANIMVWFAKPSLSPEEFFARNPDM